MNYDTFYKTSQTIPGLLSRQQSLNIELWVHPYHILNIILYPNRCQNSTNYLKAQYQCLFKQNIYAKTWNKWKGENILYLMALYKKFPLWLGCLAVVYYSPISLKWKMLGQEICDELWFPFCLIVWHPDMKDSQKFSCGSTYIIYYISYYIPIVARTEQITWRFHTNVHFNNKTFMPRPEINWKMKRFSTWWICTISFHCDLAATQCSLLL